MEQQTTECQPCKAKQKSISVSVETAQFRNADTEWSTTTINSIRSILRESANFSDLQINTLIKSLQVTPSNQQLLYAGPEQTAIKIYNQLLNLGIIPVVGGSINKF